jgi:hypothetical protein
MKMITITITGFILLFFLSSAFAPAWSMLSKTDTMTVAEGSSSNTSPQSTMRTVGTAEIGEVYSNAPAGRNCKAGHLYSAYNVVGHPLACIRGTISGVDGVVSSAVGGLGL